MSEVFFSCKRMTGIEPASKAWEALILPMNYIRKSDRETAGLEVSSQRIRLPFSF